MIVGNIIGGNPVTPKTYIFKTEDGVEIPAVLVDKETIFTAGDRQVADGYTYVSDNGASTGTREFLAYRTEQGASVVLNGDEFAISLPEHNKYDYTKLQCIIAPFNTSINDSVASDKIVLNDKVFATNSSEALSDVTKDSENKVIKLNIINDTDNIYVIRYFTYKGESLND